MKNAQTAQCRHTLTNNLICEVLTSYACNFCGLRVRAQQKNSSKDESHLMLLLCAPPVMCWCTFNNPHVLPQEAQLELEDSKMSSVIFGASCVHPALLKQAISNKRSMSKYQWIQNSVKDRETFNELLACNTFFS